MPPLLHRYFRGLVAGLAALAGATGPALAKAGPSSGSPFTFALLVPSLSQPGLLALKSGAQKAGHRLDIHILTQNAHYSAWTQSEQMNAMIAQRADMLLIDPVDPQELQPELHKAKKAGIPVVMLNRTASPFKPIAFLHYDFKLAGRKVCTKLATRLGGSGTVTILTTDKPDWTSQQAAEGCASALAATSGIKEVRWHGPGGRSGGRQAMRKLLGQPSAQAALFAPSGPMAIGAARLLRQEHRSNVAIGTVCGGTSEERSAIDQEPVAFTVLLPGRPMGEQAVDLGFRYLVRNRARQVEQLPLHVKRSH
ncbi:MAG: sugar ABC transporter substrate-binding protein [Acidiphilium sp.]|nr:sugar ABC transporter substrate-binding protein [Acidiphilium sp.]